MKNIINNIRTWSKSGSFGWLLIGLAVLLVIWAIDFIIEGLDIFESAEELKPTKADHDRWMELFLKIHDPNIADGVFGGLTEAEALEWDNLIKAQGEYSRAITGAWPRMLTAPLFFFGGWLLGILGIVRVADHMEKEGTTWTL